MGGSVRDLLLGLELRDFDIEIYDLEPKRFEIIMQKLGAKGFGKSFWVYKFQNYDLALARTESKIAHGHRGFELRLCDDERLGARRRDFTCNALMINLFDLSFLDFYGGREDLQNKILRHIDPQSFKEDSLRVLRALNFIARFAFSIAPQTKQLMSCMDVSDLSADRINAELYKFFSGENLALAYKALQELGLERRLFGVSFEDEGFFSLLEGARRFVKDEALFLYLYLNYFGLDPSAFFQKTRLKKSLLTKVNQPFFREDPSDLELLKIGLDMPIKSWLGCYSAARISQAKRLKIHTRKFQSKIKADALIRQGFAGKALGLKLKEARNLEFKKYLQEVGSVQSADKGAQI